MNDQDAELSIVSNAKLASSIEKVKEDASQRYRSTVQVLINLRGYDPKKDNKLSKDFVFPHRIRKTDKTIIVVDRENLEMCKEKGMNYGYIDELMREDKREERERLFSEMYYFILYPGYNKVYQLKNILKEGKIPYLMKPTDSLEDVYEMGNRTFKVRIVDMFVTSFVAGHTDMDTDDIAENIRTGLNLLVSHLKQKEQSIKGIIIKPARGKPVTIY
jgi:large subunit ribosomal protein L10Ae